MIKDNNGEYNGGESDIVVLINSCDLYEDAWEPFIKLFHIQWRDCPYPFVLNTESKEYKGFLSEKVLTIHPLKTNITWSQRLCNCLKQINSEFVLFILDDYFIQNIVESNIFEHAHQLMKKNKTIGMSALSYGTSNVADGKFEDELFYSRIINEKNKIWCRINLYRRDYLLSLIRDHESIWEFEEYASFRAQKLDYSIIQQKSNVPECFTFFVKFEDGFGISLRKWLPKNKELFDKYGIKVNYDNLGFLDLEEYNKPRIIAERPGGAKERLYEIKKKLLAIPKWIKKRIRIIKSKK